MAESIYLPENASKAEKYEAILPQIEALISSETDLYANLANVSAVLKEAFGFFWVGFYLVKEENLVLGPFQGPLACTRIAFGKGVCGTAWKEAKTQLVPDVDFFPGHIACSSASKSEIVIPGIADGKVWCVLDVDSDQLDDFDTTDQIHLENLMQLLSKVNFKVY
ncbi:GAF domain-containing protein [Cecembia lonarensis]|uniref:Free methionine-R-sulfoxide reductase n=1 Tax=Cecembia lonarensis (strain CCUG 58316 / KCTC 22772 / LW9) TaxID=1225176 RepID=K1LY57_CECL9|nr:GAF domain-containing protein [Cecembia lonarensis]EKB49079.1 Free methionine-R-sulfoxide reductase [Cecembia lonarensis LW9]